MMGAADTAPQEGEPGRDIVPTRLSLSAAAVHRQWAFMGGGGARTLIGPLSPPLDLCAWAYGH